MRGGAREDRQGTCQWHVTRSDWLEAQAGSQGVLRLCVVRNRGARAWAGAATRLPGAGRRGPICRGTNRAEMVEGFGRWRGEPRPTACR